ncbi:MAG: hypothetical protein ACLFUG_10770 [Nitriliruptoraceae bacterium]
MHTRSYGSIRLRGSCIEFCIPSEDGRVIEFDLDVGEHTAHALRHLVAAQRDPHTARHTSGGRPSLLQRSLSATGAAVERLEVQPGDPPRMLLALVTPNAIVRRIDLDLLDAAELLIWHRVPVVAVGWPERDWDTGLHELLG